MCVQYEQCNLFVVFWSFRLYCLTTTLKHAADQVKSLQAKETWNLGFDTRHGGTTELVRFKTGKVRPIG